MEMSDFAYGKKFVDVVRGIVRQVIEEERPRPKYATVLSWDIDTREAQVLYIEPNAEPVTVQMTCFFPYEEGQTVVVDGPRGDRRIVAVIGRLGVMP